ncbi:MAG TPA: DNA repair protein RecO [Candidatus Hydrogenedentes bacterium]|nr:DNA repair protein RecO [Candidatus Hydrogenedentota bacterium]HQE82064.1 DNA repair protein RecO [Candidatus Hydrogenedentota bacterium]HQH53323.1 DNA repair protein RecO [Candidatus Hydrogenedentota bacterium]HQM47147.1 DNA repair protein RecO [Candidatus Hydrogenedentota bacterium]
MSQERTEAVVLRGVDFSETSRIVTFLTPGRGKMACMAAGARRARSSLSGVLDTFNRLEVVFYWKDGRSVQKLAEAALLDGYPQLKTDLEKLVYAAFPLEIAYKVAQENEPSEALYSTLVEGLRSMAGWQGDVRTHAAWQAVHLLSAAGFEMTLAPRGSRDRVSFSFEHGVLSPSQPGDKWLDAREYDGLCALAAARGACPDIRDSGAVFAVLRGYAVRHVETSFRSLRVIDQVSAHTTRQE